MIPLLLSLLIGVCECEAKYGRCECTSVYNCSKCKGGMRKVHAQVFIYSSDTCRPCLKMKSELGELTKAGYTLATDDEGDKRSADFVYTYRHSLRRFPTIIAYKDGKEVFRKAGYMTTKELIAELRRAK